MEMYTKIACPQRCWEALELGMRRRHTGINYALLVVFVCLVGFERGVEKNDMSGHLT